MQNLDEIQGKKGAKQLPLQMIPGGKKQNHEASIDQQWAADINQLIENDPHRDGRTSLSKIILRTYQLVYLPLKLLIKRKLCSRYPTASACVQEAQIYHFQ